MSAGVAATRVRTGFYLDSVALMRISQTVRDVAGVSAASLMMGSPSNRELLRDANLLDSAAEAAGPNDLVIAVRADDEHALRAAFDAAEAALMGPAASGREGRGWNPRSLETGLRALPGANLAIVSVPGRFAAREARRALERGLNVMLFSDNVGIEEEIALKSLAGERGLLMMGPDCGTAIVAGAPIGFANDVPRGDIGLIAASGTGLQEVACLIARAGGGISHGIGVGGRDLGAAVGGAMTLSAIDALDRDEATERIVLISKPPDPDTAGRIADRIAASSKRFTLCCIGMAPMDLPENARQATTLRDAAEDALAGAGGPEPARTLENARRKFRGEPSSVRGLFSGGSLCAEAQAVLMAAGIGFASNVPIPGAADTGSGHRLIDLGADEYTRGRPHPMIEPAVRDAPLKEALADPDVGIVLVDVVLGHGSHEDPAGALVSVLAAHEREAPAVIASVCGTDEDPQNRAAQVEALREAGVVVAESNAGAAETAAALLRD